MNEMDKLIYPTPLIIGFSVYLTLLLLLLIGLFRLKPGQNRIKYAVSVVVVARNEEHHLKRCLPALTKQNYPKQLLQFILVNDRSHDRSGKLMDEFCENRPNCITLNIHPSEKSISPKKYALSKGILKASGRILCFTDADCQPPPNWISEMVRYFEPGVVLTAGFSPLISDTPGLWGKIIELDSLASAVVAAGSIGVGSAVTCTGRNLAYTMELFQQIDGFESHKHSLSGDDDLLVQQVKKQSLAKIRYAIGSANNVPSLAILKLSEFIRQRKRHFSAGKYYSLPLQILYFIFHLTNLMIFLGFIILLGHSDALLINGVIFTTKLLADFVVLYVGARKLYHLKLLKYFLPWEFYFLVYNMVIGPLGLISKIRWK